MQAIKIDDAYRDLERGKPYNIARVMRDYRIKLEGNPRRYKTNSFQIIHNGEIISHERAYRIYSYEAAKKKVNMK